VRSASAGTDDDLYSTMYFSALAGAANASDNTSAAPMSSARPPKDVDMSPPSE
jgi:hypothetical protein